MLDPKFCPSCGKKLKSYLSFCIYCGTAVKKRDLRVIARNQYGGTGRRAAGTFLLCIGIPILCIGVYGWITKTITPDFYMQLDLIFARSITIVVISCCIAPGIVLILQERNLNRRKK